MRILAIGAHADDVELGCGGALLTWAREGHEIVIHVASDSAYAAVDGTPVRHAADAAAEARASAEVLGARFSIGPFACFKLAESEALNTAMVALMERERPDVLLTHWWGDTHSDHAALARASLHAARRVPTVLAYTSNAYPSAEIFEARLFVDISAVLEDKLRLVALFTSENGRTGGTWIDWLRAQARAAGHAAGLAAAEAFLVIKQRLILPAPNSSGSMASP